MLNASQGPGLAHKLPVFIYTISGQELGFNAHATLYLKNNNLLQAGD